MKLRCNCGNDSFEIDIHRDCYDCAHNGFWDDNESEYIYTEKPEGVRTECQENYECQLGSNFNNGCHIYICSKCRKDLDFIPMVEA